MKRSDMTTKVTVTEVTWEDETCQVGYRVGAITPASLAEMARLGTTTAAIDVTAEDAQVRMVEAVEALSREVERMVAWWDVTDEEGVRLPATADIAATLPLSFLRAVIGAGQAAMRPPKDGR